MAQRPTKPKSQAVNGNGNDLRVVQGLSAGAVILMLVNMLGTFFFDSRKDVSEQLKTIRDELRQTATTLSDKREADLKSLRDENDRDSKALHEQQTRLLADIAEIKARLEALPSMIYEQVHRDGGGTVKR